jgi:acetyltransferase-like isoleucine patch superfamily enzyme
VKIRTWLLLDAAYLAILVITVGAPLAVACRLHVLMAAPLPGWAAPALVPVDAVVFLLAMSIAVFVLRLAVPRLRAGVYPHLGHPQSVAWAYHFALQRVVNLPLWGPLILSFSFLRFFALRALGARVPYHMHTSSDAALLDASLLEVGRGAMFGGGSLVCGHFFDDERLILAPVKIGAGVQVLGGAIISPGATIGDHAVIGPTSRLFLRVTVGEGAHIGMGCVLYNDVTVGENAVIGHQVTIETGARVGEGAVVPSGARVPKGAEIAAGARFAAP